MQKIANDCFYFILENISHTYKNREHKHRSENRVKWPPVGNDFFFLINTKDSERYRARDRMKLTVLFFLTHSVSRDSKVGTDTIGSKIIRALEIIRVKKTHT